MKHFLEKLYSYEFIRYSIWWWLAALLDLFFLWLCTDVLWFHYLLSAIISFIISFSFAYFFQKYITFRDKSKKHLKQWGLFLLFQLIWLWIYMFILWLGVDICWFYYMLVAVFWKWVAFLWNYFSNHYFNFKKL